MLPKKKIFSWFISIVSLGMLLLILLQLLAIIDLSIRSGELLAACFLLLVFLFLTVSLRLQKKEPSVYYRPKPLVYTKALEIIEINSWLYTFYKTSDSIYIMQLYFSEHTEYVQVDTYRCYYFHASEIREKLNTRSLTALALAIQAEPNTYKWKELAITLQIHGRQVDYFMQTCLFADDAEHLYTNLPDK